MNSRSLYVAAAHFRVPGTALALITAILMATPAAAQQPIRLLVGFPPGGGLDALARIVAERLQARLGSSIIVDNRPGAGGAIAAQVLQKAAADGSTYMLTLDHQVAIVPHTMKSAGYDAFKDFVPVAQVATYETCLAVSSTLGAATLGDYLALVKRNPGISNIGVPAPGSAPQFIASVLSKHSGAKFNPVPYRGAGPVIVDLLGGHIPAAILPCRDFLDHQKTGKVNILAVAGTKRLDWSASTPTLAEAGVKIDANFWIGVYAPAKLPDAQRLAMEQALKDVMTDSRGHEAIADLGFAPKFATGAMLDGVARASFSYWGAQIRESGFQAE